MTNRTLFTMPTINNNVPLSGHPFTGWFYSQPARIDNFFDALDAWLSPMGYDIKLHTLDSAAIDQAEMVYQSAWRNWSKVKNKFKVGDCFTFAPHLSTKDTFMVRGLGDTFDRYSLTPTFKSFIEGLDVGLIYNLDPQNYYFDLKGSTLFICYQYIIGSRAICTIIKD